MEQFKNIKSAAALLASAALGFAALTEARANEALSHLGGTLGASWQLGSLSNDGMGLASRTMDAFTIEALPGYRFDKFLIGVDFDYRWQAQVTSLSDAGGTNLAGNGYLLGVGAKYKLSDRVSFQASFDFIGSYSFSNQTEQANPDNLSGPISLRLKSQYFPSRHPVSVDLDLQYLNWRTFTIASTDHSNSSSQWLAGLGVTYHLGCDHSAEQPVAEVTDVAVPVQPRTDVPSLSEEADLAKVIETKHTDRGILVNLTGDMNFPPNSAVLNAQGKAKIAPAAQVIAKHPNSKVHVEGYTDTSGNKNKNMALSQVRAEAVRDALVENGVKRENVTARGFGPAKPISPNDTPENRALNRRVEIYIQDEAKPAPVDPNQTHHLIKD